MNIFELKQINRIRLQTGFGHIRYIDINGKRYVEIDSLLDTMTKNDNVHQLMDIVRNHPTKVKV